MKWTIFDEPNDVKGRQKVATYIDKKFRDWKPWKVSLRSQAWRVKAYEVLIFARGTPHLQLVKDKYFNIFHEAVPAESELLRLCPPVRERRRINADEWEEALERRIRSLNVVLAQLEEWKEGHDYEEGDIFYDRLSEAVELIDPRIMDAVDIRRMNEVSIGRKHKLDVERTDRSFNAEFEAMVGVRQEFAMSFSSGVPDVGWGQINAKLEQSFRGGVWGSGKAQAELGKLGFSAEVQAAIFIGAELEVKGSASWTKGDSELSLGGSGRVFIGGEASFEAKLSVDARKGIEAAFRAGAFAGFKAEAKGTFGIKVAGHDLMSGEVAAAVLFGVGAEIKAAVSVPILGPSTFEFAASLALGLGVETSCSFEVNFSEMALASQELLLRMKNYRHILRGYSLKLTNETAKNLYYLEKAITRFRATIEELEETIAKRNMKPEDERSLLASFDD
jgi:hypothetical protein